MRGSDKVEISYTFREINKKSPRNHSEIIAEINQRDPAGAGARGWPRESRATMSLREEE